MDYLDFGRYLTQQRELRGMSREEVAMATKIPLNLLAALENGQVERLPERVFVVNYIRAYSSVIGLAEDDAVLRFEEIDKTSDVPSAALSSVKRKNPVPAALLIALALLVAAIAALLMSGVVHIPLRR